MSTLRESPSINVDGFTKYILQNKFLNIIHEQLKNRFLIFLYQIYKEPNSIKWHCVLKMLVIYM